MTHHTLAHPGAQHVNIVDAVTPSDHRVHQRHRLATRPERTRPSQRDQLVSGNNSPALATARSSSKITSRLSSLWQAVTKNVPSRPDRWTSSQTPSSPLRGHFYVDGQPITPPSHGGSRLRRREHLSR